ncbi:hypothetical protein JVU11DRAFT_10864 [Chiua virens]|nr:hypothetical protein JVU11DRAFT_10864 [Chiua virens]
MKPSYQIDENALLAVVRVRAALALVPYIVGLRETWTFWMRDNLEREVAHLSEPTASSPHPKLLGSLKEMLYVHYTSGIEADTLRFEGIRADDPSVSGPEYVDVPEEQLPALQGDLWWTMLPLSVSLEEAPPPSSLVPLGSMAQGSSFQLKNVPGQSQKIMLKLDLSKTGRVPTGQNSASSKKRKSNEVPSGRRQTRQSNLRKSLDNDGEEQAAEFIHTYHIRKGKVATVKRLRPSETEETPEAIQVCDASSFAPNRTRVSEAGPSLQNLQRVHPVRDIQQPRHVVSSSTSHLLEPARVAKTQKSDSLEGTEELQLLLVQLMKQVTEMDKKLATSDQEKIHLRARITALERQAKFLKQQIP